MGWTYFADRPDLTRAQIIERELSQPARPDNPLAWGFEKLWERGSVVYAVAWHDKPDHPRVYFGLVCLTSRRRGEFGYKDMDETVGPYCFDAPVSMLDMLDRLAPNPPGHALDWRARCRHHHATRKARPEWKPGDRVELGTGWIYTLDRPAGARMGWHVTRNDGTQWRMNSRQLARATKTDAAPTKHTTKEVSPEEFFASLGA